MSRSLLLAWLIGASAPLLAAPPPATAPVATPVPAAAPAAAQAGNPIPQPPAVDARAYILLDHDSGRVLAESHADDRMEPASLTKLMTSYAVFAALKEGRLKLADTVTISEHAWKAEGSRTFVQVGTQIPAEVLIKGMLVQSGNDATIVTPCLVVNGCYVNVPFDAKVNPPVSFTIEAWVRVDWIKGDPQAYRAVLDARDFDPCTGFGIFAKVDDNTPDVYHWRVIIGNGGTGTSVPCVLLVCDGVPRWPRDGGIAREARSERFRPRRRRAPIRCEHQRARRTACNPSNRRESRARSLARCVTGTATG